LSLHELSVREYVYCLPMACSWDSSDPSLRDLVERILPLATYYTALTAFVEQRSHLDFGLVNHALCASMRDMLKVRSASLILLLLALLGGSLNLMCKYCTHSYSTLFPMQRG
jgi:hypothetical protein